MILSLKKNTLSGNRLYNLQVKVHKTCVTIIIYRIILPVFDWHKFCQHLLTLNVDHPRKMASAPLGPGHCT